MSLTCVRMRGPGACLLLNHHDGMPMSGNKRRQRERLVGVLVALLLWVALGLLAGVVQIATTGSATRTLAFDSTPWAAEKVASTASVARAPARRAKIAVQLPEAMPERTVSRRALPADVAMAASANGSQRARRTRATARPTLQRRAEIAPRLVLKKPAIAIEPEKAKRGLAMPPSEPARKRVPRRAVNDIADIEEELSNEAVDVDAILDWMRLAPGELPPGILRHVDYQPGNLTATAHVESKGEHYELYILARVPIREIHVVLVGQEHTYYLIDRSFQGEGRAFRMGTARRNDGVITGVFSEERAASSVEARVFYDIFLAWWAEERLRL